MYSDHISVPSKPARKSSGFTQLHKKLVEAFAPEDKSLRQFGHNVAVLLSYIYNYTLNPPANPHNMYGMYVPKMGIRQKAGHLYGTKKGEEFEPCFCKSTEQRIFRVLETLGLAERRLQNEYIRTKRGQRVGANVRYIYVNMEKVKALIDGQITIAANVSALYRAARVKKPEASAGNFYYNNEPVSRGGSPVPGTGPLKVRSNTISYSKKNKKEEGATHRSPSGLGDARASFSFADADIPAEAVKSRKEKDIPAEAEKPHPETISPSKLRFLGTDPHRRARIQTPGKKITDRSLPIGCDQQARETYDAVNADIEAANANKAAWQALEAEYAPGAAKSWKQLRADQRQSRNARKKPAKAGATKHQLRYFNLFADNPVLRTWVLATFPHIKLSAVDGVVEFIQMFKKRGRGGLAYAQYALRGKAVTSLRQITTTVETAAKDREQTRTAQRVYTHPSKLALFEGKIDEKELISGQRFIDEDSVMLALEDLNRTPGELIC